MTEEALLASGPNELIASENFFERCDDLAIGRAGRLTALRIGGFAYSGRDGVQLELPDNKEFCFKMELHTASRNFLPRLQLFAQKPTHFSFSSAQK